jgi:hypothetical protein
VAGGAGVVDPGGVNVTTIVTGRSPMLTTLSLRILVLRTTPARFGVTTTLLIVDPGVITGTNAVKGNVASATFCTAFEPTTELTRTQSLFNGAASWRVGALKLQLQAESQDPQDLHGLLCSNLDLDFWPKQSLSLKQTEPQLLFNGFLLPKFPTKSQSFLVTLFFSKMKWSVVSNRTKALPKVFS